MSTASVDLFGPADSQPPVGTTAPPLATLVAYTPVACVYCVADGPIYDGNCAACWLRDIAGEIKPRLLDILTRPGAREKLVEYATDAGKEYVQRLLRAVANAKDAAYANAMKADIVAARSRRQEGR